MDSDTPDRTYEFEARISALEAELAKWRNLQIAPESGGGGVTQSDNSVIIRINALTPSGIQMP